MNNDRYLPTGPIGIVQGTCNTLTHLSVGSEVRVSLSRRRTRVKDTCVLRCNVTASSDPGSCLIQEWRRLWLKRKSQKEEFIRGPSAGRQWRIIYSCVLSNARGREAVHHIVFQVVL